MSVSEYRDKFIQLSRYAPEEVAEDERKQEHFIEGLNGPLQYALGTWQLFVNSPLCLP
jgi:hypothetical protein